MDQWDNLGVRTPVKKKVQRLSNVLEVPMCDVVEDAIEVMWSDVIGDEDRLVHVPNDRREATAQSGQTHYASARDVGREHEPEKSRFNL